MCIVLPLQTNCNLICGPEYTPQTKNTMGQMTEKETSFELVEALLKYIETLKVSGAVLVFLPGWNLIFSMQRHLETNPHFGLCTTSVHTCPPFRSLSLNVAVVFQGAIDTGSCRYILRFHARSRGGCLTPFLMMSPRWVVCKRVKQEDVLYV